MSQPFDRNTISFIVRLWPESEGPQNGSRWRGQIEHVGSGEKSYFQVPTAVLEFLVSHLPAALGRQGVMPAGAAKNEE